jgi:predicted negative regulator of RcsB-dependent stress response
VARYNRIKKKEDVDLQDELIDFWDSVYIWVGENRERVVLPVLGVVLALALFGGFSYYKDSREQAAQRELAIAIADYPREGVDKEKVDIDKMLADVDAVAGRFGGTLGGRMATLYKGHLLYMQGMMEEAVPVYKSAYDAGKAGETFTVIAGLGLARAYQNTGKYAESAEVLKEMKKKPVPMFEEEIDFLIAQSFELLGETDQALDSYANILAGYPESRRKDAVTERMVALGGSAGATNIPIFDEMPK